MFTILDTNLWLQAISTVRWITTFSRILRYYMQHPNPSEALKEIVNYIMKESGQIAIFLILMSCSWFLSQKNWYPKFIFCFFYFAQYVLKPFCRELKKVPIFWMVFFRNLIFILKIKLQDISNGSTRIRVKIEQTKQCFNNYEICNFDQFLLSRHTLRPFFK